MSISEKDCRVLFQKSGNRCALPGCGRLLTFAAQDGTGQPETEIAVSDIAHIVARSSDGPRGSYHLPTEKRDLLENLILLCKEHHRVIDSHPATYPVERLRAMKEEHEAAIAKATGDAIHLDSPSAPASSYVREQLYSTLLPVERMPRYVYSAPASLRTENEVKKALTPCTDPSVMLPFIVRANRLYCFNNLRAPSSPFRNAVDLSDIQRERSSSWWRNEDKQRWFQALLNRALNKLTGRKGLLLDKDHERYYFQSDEPGNPLSVIYRPLNVSSSQRSAVWQPKSRKTGIPRNYWYHLAVALKFDHIASRSWLLSLRPEYRVTRDGLHPLRSEMIGGKVTQKRAHSFNNDLLEDIQFWRAFLSDGQPRITFQFGQGQQIIVGSSMLSADIHWPGMPEEYKIKFRNIDFEENLFTLADREQLDDEYEDELEGGECEDDQHVEIDQ